MIKTFCDVCKKEVEPTAELGALAYIDKVFSMKDSNATSPRLVEKKILFCGECLDRVKKFIDKNAKK